MTRLRTVFFGSPAFAVPSLEAVLRAHDVALVITQPDRPAGRGMKLQPPPVKALALEHGLSVEQPTRLKDNDELLARLRGLEPDAFIVVAYGRILPQVFLDVPRLGPYNVHASILPRHRGAAPIQRAVMVGDTETGVAIMRMEAGLDTGPVVAQRTMPINADDTAGTMFDKLARLGADLLLETLPAIAEGRAVATPQDHTRVTLAPMLSKDDGHLDFAQAARLVSARARGVDPWPGAFARLGDDVVKLFGARVVEGVPVPPGAVAGQVISVGPVGLVVACGEGAVAFAELQLAGRKRMGAATVLAGHPLPPATRLQ